MKKLLYVNSCIRKHDSRTRALAVSFFFDLENSFEVEEVDLNKENLKCLTGDFFREREDIIEREDFNHPMFNLARNFANADIIVIAAPFWELSFPAMLKVYIENISVETITFKYNETGQVGLCKATDLVYITTRGGSFENSPLENGARYIESMSKFWGIENFHCISADNLDLDPSPSAVEALLNFAKIKGKEVANILKHKL